MITHNEIHKEHDMTLDEALQQCIAECRMDELKINNNILNLDPVATYSMMEKASELIDGVVCFVQRTRDTYMVLDGRWRLFTLNKVELHVADTHGINPASPPSEIVLPGSSRPAAQPSSQVAQQEFWKSWEDSAKSTGPKTLSRSAKYESSMQLTGDVGAPLPAAGRKRLTSR